MTDRIEEGIALDRLDQLMRLQRRICLEQHQALVGKTMPTLVERNGRGISWGRSAWDAPDIDGRVRVNGIVSPGEIVPVRITRAHAYQLDGEPLSPGREIAQRDSWLERTLPVLSSL